MQSAWAERTYHLLHLGGPVILHAGRAAYPHDGRRPAFAGLTDGHEQRALRLAGSLPDGPRLGPLIIEAVRPDEEIRLVLDGDAGTPFAFDLTFRARFAPVETAPNRIERDGEVVTDYT